MKSLFYSSTCRLAVWMNKFKTSSKDSNLEGWYFTNLFRCYMFKMGRILKSFFFPCRLWKPKSSWSFSYFTVILFAKSFLVSSKMLDFFPLTISNNSNVFICWFTLKFNFEAISDNISNGLIRCYWSPIY